MLKSFSEKFEHVILLVLAFAVLAVVGTFLFHFYDLKIGTDLANWGQFGDYFGGTLNPIIGLVTAYFAYKAYQNTKVVAQQQKVVSIFEMFLKVYDHRLPKFIYDPIDNRNTVFKQAEPALVGEEAISAMHLEIQSSVLHIMELRHLAGTREPFELYEIGRDRFLNLHVHRVVNELRYFVLPANQLLGQLTDRTEKTQFESIVFSYFDSRLISAVSAISSSTCYQPENSEALRPLKEFADTYTKYITSI